MITLDEIVYAIATSVGKEEDVEYIRKTAYLVDQTRAKLLSNDASKKNIKREVYAQTQTADFAIGGTEIEITPLLKLPVGYAVISVTYEQESYGLLEHDNDFGSSPYNTSIMAKIAEKTLKFDLPFINPETEEQERRLIKIKGVQESSGIVLGSGYPYPVDRELANRIIEVLTSSKVNTADPNDIEDRVNFDSK